MPEVAGRRGATAAQMKLRPRVALALSALDAAGSPLELHLERYSQATGSRMRITFEPEGVRP